MTRSRSQLALVLVAAFMLAVLGSRLLADWVKIRTTVSEPLTFGQPNGKPPAFRSGSSLADYQINWGQIAAQTGTEIKAWGVAGGSPYEFEQFQKRVPEARTTYIVLSAFDMNEANVSDFRAAVVPLNHAIGNLRAIHADWNYSKRVLSQYPMTWLRILFPTLGRSRDVMGAILIKVKDIVNHSSRPSETPAGPTLKFGNGAAENEYARQKLSDWSKSKIIGKLTAMRSGFQGSDAFIGPKFIALLRMLEYGCQRGPTIVIVVPVSTSYSKKFMSQEMVREFETSLAEAQRQYPKVQWLRLDQVPGLASDKNFCDLVHMNTYGNQIATEVFGAWLKQPAYQP